MNPSKVIFKLRYTFERKKDKVPKVFNFSNSAFESAQQYPITIGFPITFCYNATHMSEDSISQLIGECVGPQGTGPAQEVTIDIIKPGEVVYSCRVRDLFDNSCGISPVGGKCVYRALDFAGTAINPKTMGEHNADLIEEDIAGHPDTPLIQVSERIGLDPGQTSRAIRKLQTSGRIEVGDPVKIGRHKIKPLRIKKR